MEEQKANFAIVKKLDANNTGQSVLFDIGSGEIKAGFTGSSAPRTIFPTLIGRNRNQYSQSGLCLESKDRYIGDEAMEKRGFLSLTHPIEHGVVNNWDVFEEMIGHAFKDGMRIDPKGQPFFFSQPVYNPIQNREKIIQILFETFEVPKIACEYSPMLSLMTSGRTTGLALDSGEGVTSLLPVYEGSVLTRGIKRSHLAGGEVTDSLVASLRGEGHYFESVGERETVRLMKEKLSYVPLDYYAEMQRVEMGEKHLDEYELPDGKVVSVNAFTCAECLFDPSRVGLGGEGMAGMVYQSIQKCDMTLRRDLYANIVLSGGNTLMTGFSERLHQDLIGLLPVNGKVKVIAPPERRYSVWIGASILTSLSSYKGWLLSGTYDEVGPAALNKRFPF